MAAKNGVESPSSSEAPASGLLEKGGKSSLAQEPATMSRYRLLYLSFNLFSVLIVMLGGIFAYKMTNSLSVMLNGLGSGADALAVIVNIGIELGKMQVSSERTVLILDLAGCVLSLCLLLGVAIFGVIDAVPRTEEAWKEHLSHLNMMVAFSAGSLVFSSISLSLFFLLRSRILGSSGKGVSDDLNMTSALVHAVVDLVSNIAVFFTAIWLLNGSFKDEPEPWRVQAGHKARIDACGALVVCLCVTAAIAFFFKAAMKMVVRIHELDSSEGNAGAAVSPGSSQSYGTMGATGNV